MNITTSRWGVALLFATIVVWHTRTAIAQPATVTPLVTKLDRPSAVAVRPGSTPTRHAIYFADDRGPVRRFLATTPNDISVAVTDLPPGPKKLFFLDRNRLIVAAPAKSAESPSLFVFELKDDTSQSADQAAQKISLNSSDASAESPLLLTAITRTMANDRVPDLLIIPARSGNDSSALSKLPIRAGTLDKPSEFATALNRIQPAALAISNQGFIVAATLEYRVDALESRLFFLSPIDGSLAMSVPTEQNQILALAYSPKTGSLYAANYGNASRGVLAASGIFRIEDAAKPGTPAAKLVKVADVLRPTAMSFAPDGTLYVSADGDPDPYAPDKGLVVKVIGDL